MATSKVILNGAVAMDVTQTTVQSNNLESGATALDNKGDLITGSTTVGKIANLDWTNIKQCVNEGVDASFLPIGTQIADKWTWNGVTYDAPWEVAHYNSEGMYLQWVYCTPSNDIMQFDKPEALYYVGEEGLSAGTYYISIGYATGQWTTDKHIQFTLSQACDPGDQFVLNAPSSSTDPTANITVNVYSKGGTTIKQTTTTSDGTDGIELGTTPSNYSISSNGNVNNPDRVFGGYGRWSQSAVRQWLNSDAPAGQWWQPQNPWDRPPSKATIMPGFLSGFSDAFKSTLETIKVTTLLKQGERTENECYDITYDKIFLPSLNQTYTVHSTGSMQFFGVEGEPWDYWKNMANDAGIEWYMKGTGDVENALRKRYYINNHNAVGYRWTRSSGQHTNMNQTYIFDNYSRVTAYTTSTERCCLPACVIKKSTPSYIDRLNKLDWTTIKKMATLGSGTSLDIGSQIVDTWTDVSGTTYNVPWDVVHYDDEGMYLQAHYSFPDGRLYSVPSALYYVGENGLPAGTYYISIGYSNNKWTTDKHIQFTLSQACDPGDQLCINVTSISTDPTENKTITVYGFGETTVKQTATTSDGTDGIELGSTSDGSLNDMLYKPNGNVNKLYDVFYGTNRWGHSAIRQWLNSDAPAGQWWTPMTPWDRPPSYAATSPGFLSGFTQDFKSILATTPVKTLLNTLSGYTNAYEVTYDKMFLPSVTQLYSNPEVFDVEGEPFDYYRQLAEDAGITGYMNRNQSECNSLRIKYKLNATNYTTYAWLRSSQLTNYGVYLVMPTGYISTSSPGYGYYVCPVCKINLIK